MTLIAIFVMSLAGCASHHPSDASNQPLSDSGITTTVLVYTASPAPALVFDPPALAGSPRLDLSREDRGPAAFAGYEDETTTFYYLRVDDWLSDSLQGAGTPSRENYDRRSVSETYGTTHR